MKTIHTNSPEVVALAMAAFPNYKGRTFEVRAHTGSMRLDSCWSGGSRSYYVAVDMASGRQVSVPENGTPWSNGGQIMQADTIPAGIAIVEHCIFCGKDIGIKIHVHPDTLNRFALPAPVTLTIAQRIVLAFTAGRKSSYNGKNRAEMALEDSGLPLAEWEQAKAELITLGFLKSSNAITNEGRNACGDDRCESLRYPGFKRFAWEADSVAAQPSPFPVAAGSTKI